MTQQTPPPPPEEFDPVPVRPRADGWTAERQTGFIAALARTANVEAACRAVGMGTSSAYELRARPDAAAFRDAWEVALNYAVHRLGEAALDRAINGTATPVFFKGEQIGEHRRYDEKLTMFLLRLRDPERYGRWREDRVPHGKPDGPAAMLQAALVRVENEAEAIAYGAAPDRLPPLPGLPMLTREQDAQVTPWWMNVARRAIAPAGARRRRSKPDTAGGM